MGKRLHKRDRITVRFTTAQAREIETAARMESQRRGELVEESTLIRELALIGVRSILDQSKAA